MPKFKQETREAKLNRAVRNLTRVLDQHPDLRSVRRRKSELETRLRDMPADEELALVPWEETACEAKANIETIEEFIEEARTDLSELLTSRAKFIRELKFLTTGRVFGPV